MTAPELRFLWIVTPAIRDLASFLPANHRLVSIPVRRGLRRIFSEAFALRRLAAREKVDLFRFHSVQYSGPVALLLRLMGARQPFLFQHLHVEEPRSRYRFWARILSFLGAHFACISQASLEDLVGLGVPRENCSYVKTILFGWDRSLTNSAATSKSYDLVYVGGLIPRKRPGILLDVADELARRQPREQIKVAIIGRGELRANLEERARKSTAKIDFFPDCDDDTKWKILQASKIFFFPSSQEGFGYAPLEAALAGLWVISSDAGSLREVLENLPNSVLVPSGNFETIAVAGICEKLLSQSPPLVPDHLIRNWTDPQAWSQDHQNLIRRLVESK